MNKEIKLWKVVLLIIGILFGNSFIWAKLENKIEDVKQTQCMLEGGAYIKDEKPERSSYLDKNGNEVLERYKYKDKMYDVVYLFFTRINGSSINIEPVNFIEYYNNCFIKIIK